VSVVKREVLVERLVAHPLHPQYPLLPGDVIVQDPDGSWTKHAPGLAMAGLELSDVWVATCTRATDKTWTIL
jgi:hypothetical protein